MIQKRAVRFTTNTYNRTMSITALIKDLAWDTFQNRRPGNRVTVLQKARQGLLALPVVQLLEPSLRQSRYTHPDSYQIIACKKDVYKHSFLTETLIDWNKLLHSIIRIKDSPSFKEAVLKHLISTKNRNPFIFLVHSFWSSRCVYKACLAASGLITYVCAAGVTQRRLENPNVQWFLGVWWVGMIWG